MKLRKMKISTSKKNSALDVYMNVIMFLLYLSSELCEYDVVHKIYVSSMYMREL